MATEGLGLEITELRLGLTPWGGGGGGSGGGSGGVNFQINSGEKNTTSVGNKAKKKRGFMEISNDNIFDRRGTSNITIDDDESGERLEKSEMKSTSKINGVVGWPPVCSFRRKNSFNGRGGGGGGGSEEEEIAKQGTKIYVKVSMDGAPILRKIDLASYNDYSHFLMALDKLFISFPIGEALKVDVESNEYVPIYEDKDGDWMLAGDVPWEMFTKSCKRLRIMRRADANGIGLHMKNIHHKGTSLAR